ncbi:MAG: hypothetical protein H6623_09110 [Bdellovibrionaceae bacterium]|nr:hypothetical protein [Pseudobdellovibrionaceae bacterium]
MKKVFFLFFFLPICTWAQSGEYKGASEMGRILDERILVPKSANPTIITLFEFTDSPDGLIPLLGFYNSGSIGTGVIQNGTPNAFNVILWNMLMTNLAHRLSQECDPVTVTEDSLVVQDDIVKKIKALCAWPLPAAKDESLYQELFDAITMYEVPHEEYVEWYSHFVGSGEYDGMDNKLYVQNLMYAVFMNPYFLLQR